MNVLCIGCGFSARALARRLAADGIAITGTKTKPDSPDARALAANGIRVIGFDGQGPAPDLAAAIAAATHVVISVPPDGCGRNGGVPDPVLRHHGDDLSRSAGLGWIGYLSTIGVYGDRQGAWVDEATPLAPTSERSRRRLAAEAAWCALGRASAGRVDIFRLAGIYGPGRSAVDQLRAGTARRIVKPGQVFNRIHVDDIATTLEAAMAMRHDASMQTFNVTDDEPAPPQDVVAFAAQLLGLPVPPAIAIEAAGLSPMGASFYAEAKRVRNARIKAILGVRLAYPTYREGLAALASAAG